MIPLLDTNQLRKVDAEAIRQKEINSIDLMEIAGTKCAEQIIKIIPESKTIFIFCGTGNNGGDGLVIARILFSKGYNLKLFILKTGNSVSPDFSANLELLKQIHKNQIEIKSIDDLPVIEKEIIVIDAILGVGATREPSDLILETIKLINKNSFFTISIDVPSGLKINESCKHFFEKIIHATITLSIGLPKLGFLFPENDECTGDVIAIDIGLSNESIEKEKTNNHLVNFQSVKSSIGIRKKSSHKGSFGHALIIGGSYGKTGAIVLASKACLRSGVGLVTSQITKSSYEIVQTSIPEAMVLVDDGELNLETLANYEKYNCIAIGPGIGMHENTIQLLKGLIHSAKVPVVFDADALNILSENKTWLSFLPLNSVLTPHVKEFERLFGKAENDFERLELLRINAIKHRVTIVLKGHHTIIASTNGNCYFNSTGNAGMATGGSGDVLTGIIASFIAQGHETLYACINGVFLHGLAGDIALNSQSEESLIASDIVENLGNAFKKIRMN